MIEDAKRHKNDRAYFYKARAEFNEIVRNGFEIPDIRLASLFLYLNKTAFNGLYRENRRGEFNVPFGKYKPKIVDEERLRKASEVLKKLDIYNEDFTHIVRVAKPGDLVYFDPPYHPISETASFTSYSKEDFSKEDQERLKSVCLKLHEKRVYFILSNSYVKPIRELYDGVSGFEILKVYAKRPINSKADRRGKVPEMLVTNVPKELQLGWERAKLLVNNSKSRILVNSKSLVEYLTLAE